MNIKLQYNKYKIDKAIYNKVEIKNMVILIDQKYEGFFIGKIEDNCEINPLNMDKIITFYSIRKSDIFDFKNELNDLKYLEIEMVELDVILKINNKKLIYRRNRWIK